MLERIQALAGFDGLIDPASVQVFDAPVVTDPVSDQPRRGELREVILPPPLRKEIADFINAKLGGASKAEERIAAAREDKRIEREKKKDD
jgi:hypothetical protein